MDIVCSAFSGLIGYDVMELAIYDGPDGFGLLTKYPKPQTSVYGHIMPFSLNVIKLYIFTCDFNNFEKFYGYLLASINHYYKHYF